MIRFTEDSVYGCHTETIDTENNLVYRDTGEVYPFIDENGYIMTYEKHRRQKDAAQQKVIVRIRKISRLRRWIKFREFVRRQYRRIVPYLRTLCNFV